MADFKLVTAYAGWMPQKTLAKASATVIEPGDMVTLTSGLATKADHASTSIAFCPNGWITGDTTIQVLNDANAEFTGTADANFAVTQRGTEVDLVMSGTAQQIDVGSSTTDVFKVSIGSDAGTVDAKTNVKVRINKFLY
jgi:hypothetical protein